MGLWRQCPSSPRSRPLFPVRRQHEVPILMLLQCCPEIQPGRGKHRPGVKIKNQGEPQVNPRKEKVERHLIFNVTPSPPSPLGDELTVRLQPFNTELPKKLNHNGEKCESGKDQARANEGLWQPTPHGEPRLLDWRHGATVDSRRCDA